MPTTWIIFVVMVWVLGCLLGGMLSGVFMETGSGNPMDTLLEFRVFTSQEVLGGLFSIPWFNTEWFDALMDIVTWNFALFTTTTWGMLIRYLFLAISVGVGGTVLLTVAQTLLRR